MRAHDVLTAYGLSADRTASISSSREITQVARELSEHIVTESRDRAVYASGVGKSGLAALKFVGTCRSLREQVHYIDPLTAMHGDIGAIWRDDVLVLVSASGETDELIALAQQARARGARLLTVTKRAPNTLKHMARGHGGWCLYSENPQLDPDHLPTVSFMSAVAVLDALAVELVGPKRTLDHPSGAIGRALAR